MRGNWGGTCCVYHQGEKVVDLWGGYPEPALGTERERFFLQ
jgi:hypothetical protein